MPKVTFASQSSRSADNIAFSPERLLNLYPEFGPEGAKGIMLLRSVLGQTSFANLGTNTLRAMGEVNGVLYAVGGGNLYSISSGGTTSSLGAVSDDTVTTISGNGTNVTVCAGGNYYVWDGATMSEPGSGRFSSEGTVSFMDQYTIISQQSGQEFEWTTLADPATRVASQYATNESANDDTLRVLADRRELWFFGEQSTEVWYNTGQGGVNAFARLNGGALETGVLAANLAVKADAGIFFIGDDKVAYLASGLQLQPISTPAVNQAIDDSTPTHCFYYEDRGHRFFCIRFSDRPAWCYDASTGLWHERSTGVNHGAWEVIATAKAFGKWYHATSTGVIYEASRTNADVSHALRRTAISRNLYLEGNQFTVAELEFLMRLGDHTLGRDATLMLKVSRDGGRTFGSEMTLSAGGLGEFETRVIKRALGRGRQFCVDVSMTDADEITLYSDANVRVT